ncbi:chromosome partitioning protein ParB [Paenibacillus sp. BIHB 4019]|uniref:Chromosome partitioning protein ParB n=1 Tax=Paenibacillus sp. BIHB 4019 TaxID=1870819 RepID=A0A1B2DCF9_9BACL|nr:ParB/RepB/Spo0J family partition protein [Paenibacillus sp. BIHB 4019]ANY65404.1 chromosome partitioning protein ParB [Paenibacillus sp. BIHB 4019]
MDIIQMDINLIDEDTDQPRYQFDEQSLQELVTSISELGLLSPIKVRKTDNGRYKIIYGNRRYKACIALGKPTIPCIVSTMTNEMDIYLEQIAENLTREGFSPIEEAEAFHKLLNNEKFSSSVKFLASKLSKPESYIKNKCELLKFSSAVKKRIVSGTAIRKDMLTEDQLLPIKDLPMELRDPLALIFARDEMPVSDVKKIAKLFKDADISASTKEKLLFKNGPALLETWSIRQNNKAERAKPAQPAEAKKKAAPLQAEQQSGQQSGQQPMQQQLVQEQEQHQVGVLDNLPNQTALLAADAASAHIAAVSVSAAQPPAANVPEATVPANAVVTLASTEAEADVDGMPPVLAQLQQLMMTLEAAGAPPLAKALESMETEARDTFLQDVDKLIVHLQHQLMEWNQLKE